MFGMAASFYDKVPCNLIHELSVAVLLLPTSALSESHCFTVGGGGTGSGA